MSGKTTGLGDNFYLDGYDVSGDVGSVQTINNKRALLDVTGIDKDAMERLPGLGDAELAFNTWYNPNSSLLVGAIGAHEVLKNLSSSRHVMYFRGTTLGARVAAMIAAQATYALNRTAEGALTGAIQLMNASGRLIDWGRALTAGKHASSAPENLTGYMDPNFPNGSVGQLIAYLQIFEITGGAGNDITVKLQHSDYGTAIIEDDDAVLLVTNLLTNHTYAPNGASFSTAEARRVEVTIVDTTLSIVAGHVNIIGTNAAGDAQSELISIASGAGVHKTTKFFRTVISVVTQNDVTVLGGAGDETIKVGVEASVISYGDITAGAFANVDIADAPYKERLEVAGPIKRYMRVVAGTVSGYTTATFAVSARRN